MTHWREEFLISFKGFCRLQFNVLYNGIKRGLVIFQAFISLIIYKMINNVAWGNVFSKPSINDVEGSGYTHLIFHILIPSHDLESMKGFITGLA